MSEVIQTISDSNGWLLTLVGFSTVLSTLAFMYFFLRLFSIFADRTALSPESHQSPKQMRTLIPEMEPMSEYDLEEDMEPEPVLDDTLPRMAAAAAVAAFIKRRKTRESAIAGQSVSDWTRTGRKEAIHNLPSRHPWRDRR